MWKIEKLIRKGDYDYALVPDHPFATKNGYVLYHRIVMENEIGRILNEDEVVHHINNKRRDNRIENLKLMNSTDHNKLHGESAGKTFVIFQCPVCKTIFEKEKRNSLDKGKNKKSKLFFCSKGCSSKYQFLESKEEFTENIIKIYKKYSEGN